MSSDKEANQERENILQTLSTQNFHEKQRDTFAKHSEGTGQWILMRNEFQHWASGDQNSTLWCYGNRKFRLPLHDVHGKANSQTSGSWEKRFHVSSLTVRKTSNFMSKSCLDPLLLATSATLRKHRKPL
jgi:hypothetical protein